ncbi:MAG: hypothetical protein PWP47_737 [Synergistaceae bacterium]|nr:hypothetical protein [Synergistaceae bacterium]
MLFFLPGPARGAARFSLAAVGDALIHKGVYAAAATKAGGYDFRPMLRMVKSRIAPHDAAFYNQETILGGTKLGLSTYPRFNSPREVGDAFLDADFNLVSLANNHTLDRGEKGVLASLEYWNEKKGVVTAGSSLTAEKEKEIRFFRVNGISCAFLAYTTATNGLKAPEGKEHYVSLYTPEKAKSEVSRAQKKADVVIVSMHWGSEYAFAPTGEQKKIAEHLASLGVSIILGHHPHVVQPVAMVKNTLVVYSLGNFLSAQKDLHKLVGLLVSLDVVRTEMRGETRISFENVTGTLLYNPRRSLLGRYVVVPFDMLREDILKDFTAVYKKYAAIVAGGDSVISMRAPAKAPPPKERPAAKKAPRGK